MGRGGSTSDFFNFIDKQNNAIAAREAGKHQPATGVGVDRIRERDMEKRREEAEAAGWRLGAKPRARSRPVTARIVRGHHENPGAE